MIVFLVTPEHAYTHRKLQADAGGVDVAITTYPQAFAARTLPGATYVFTDLDRLSAPHLRTAAALYRCLRDAGSRVLNDPARVPSRYGLLRGLHEQGINRYNAYRVEEAVQPERWPVFVRLEGDHQVRASPLLHDWDAVCRTVEDALARGLPIASLLIVEYAAEPVRPGLFRRLSCFRLGAQQFPAGCVHEDDWWVKFGKTGIAPAELYDDELRIMREDPWHDALARVFALAGVEYGRADFGLLEGAPQIYEINTNPVVSFGAEHPFPARLESYRLLREHYLEGLARLDASPPGAEATLSSPLFTPWRQVAPSLPEADDFPRLY